MVDICKLRDPQIMNEKWWKNTTTLTIFEKHCRSLKECVAAEKDIKISLNTKKTLVNYYLWPCVMWGYSVKCTNSVTYSEH